MESFDKGFHALILVSDGNQPPMTFDLFLSETLCSRSLDHLGPKVDTANVFSMLTFVSRSGRTGACSFSATMAGR
jgi:hypothetical protein